MGLLKKREPLSKIQERTNNEFKYQDHKSSAPTGQIQQEKDCKCADSMACDHLLCLQENLKTRQNQTKAKYS